MMTMTMMMAMVVVDLRGRQGRALKVIHCVPCVGGGQRERDNSKLRGDERNGSGRGCRNVKVFSGCDEGGSREPKKFAEHVSFALSFLLFFLSFLLFFHFVCEGICPLRTK